LKDKSSKRGVEEAILGEPVLGEEWLAPEEDEAWKVCEGRSRRCALSVLRSRPDQGASCPIILYRAGRLRTEKVGDVVEKMIEILCS
jgi:hypothetical protein